MSPASRASIPLAQPPLAQRRDVWPARIAALRQWADELERATGEPAALGNVRAPDPAPVTASWRERLWTVPPETRIGTREVAEAFGRPLSWVYRHTSAAITDISPLPHRKLGAELVFVVGDLRAWLATEEEIIATVPKGPRA